MQSGHDYNTTVIGHSYGSLVGAHAVAYGMRADSFVAISSPGLGIVDRSEFDAFYGGSSSHPWAARTPGDSIAGNGTWSFVGGNFLRARPLRRGQRVRPVPHEQARKLLPR